MTMKKKPWNKRWPGEYAIKAQVVTPQGSRLEFEAPLAETTAEKICTILADAVAGSEYASDD
jgi:hypothetical protein